MSRTNPAGGSTSSAEWIDAPLTLELFARAWTSLVTAWLLPARKKPKSNMEEENDPRYLGRAIMPAKDKTEHGLSEFMVCVKVSKS